MEKREKIQKIVDGLQFALSIPEVERNGYINGRLAGVRETLSARNGKVKDERDG